MTIYTPSLGEKTDQKNKLEAPEVVTEPLTGFKDEAAEDSTPKPVRVTYFPKRRRPLCFYLSFIFAVLVIVACSITGGVIFYRHIMTRKVFTGRCGNTFYDTEYHKMFEETSAKVLPLADGTDNQNLEPMLDRVDEDIKVSELDMFEELHTPSFDDVMESLVMHEFNKNFSAIIDNNLRRCFVMKLNQSAIAPPPAVVTLLKKLLNGFSMPRAKVIREVYVTSEEAVSDLEPFGERIMRRCRLFPTFWATRQPIREHVFDNFSMTKHLRDIYAMLSNQMEGPTLFKLHMQPLQRTPRFPPSF